jgi:hypothetical protein
MPELDFQVEGAEAIPYSAAPQLALKLRVRSTPAAQPVHSAMLRCQVRIDPARRPYQSGEQEKLFELFGEPRRWGQTLRGMLWAHANLLLPGFTGEALADLPVPCTFDFNVAVARYFHALEGGAVPLCLLFSGTVFYEAEGGQLQVAQVPWEKEALYQLPVRVWKDMMDLYYPNSAWLCLRRDVLDRLGRYKTEKLLPTWEQALERLLDAADRSAS